MRSAARLSVRDYLAYAALAILFAAACVFQWRESRDRLSQFVRPDQIRLPFEGGVLSDQINDVQPEAEAVGIVPGHYLVTLNGRRVRGAGEIVALLRNAKAGDVVVLGTRSTPDGPVEHEASVKLEAAYGEARRPRDWLFALTSTVGVPIACIALGFFVAAVRIRDPQAWIMLMLLLGVSRVGGTSTAYWGHDDALQPFAIVYLASTEMMLPIGMALFGIYFGERLAIDRRHPWLKWLLLGPLLYFTCAFVAMTLLAGNNWAAAIAVARRSLLFSPAFVVCMVASAVVFFAAIGFKAITSASADVRRRLRLVGAGTFVGLGPFLLGFLRSIVTGRDGFEDLPFWIVLLVLASVFVLPVTLAYVIVVHKALDVRVVIRQGVQYLFAASFVRLLQILLIAGVILGVALLVRDGTNRPQRLTMVAFGALGIVGIQRGSTRVGGWVDRWFFREAYDADVVLNDLANRVRTFVEAAPLAETVARGISASLHVPRVALLVRVKDSFQVAYALGKGIETDGLRSITIPDGSATIDRLARDGHARVYPEDDDSWIHDARVSGDERAALERLEAQLLLPLTLNQRIIGILSLGPKRSDAPYSKGDLRLLESVATQTALALENSRLAAAIAAEVSQRERMNRELEIAREVQERLFPQDCPPIDGLDYAGACRPALGVGGDYYDFIPLSPTELGIAIGDVSGKGIPAALLMSGLRASLRALQQSQGVAVHEAPGVRAFALDAGLARMMSIINELVYESSSSNRYATFFYGQYDAVTRSLVFVNAGHNPPIVLRRGGEVLRLETGGPVVGLLPACHYEQGMVELHAGDVFVAFTDGVSEAMNPSDEEWGEERLIACASALKCGAREAIAAIMSAADGFAAGAKQHDDMTVLVARVLS
ncbi:MAG TPA: GAF domain-containing SpoIIE family protein phosphatase [Vicinamibacterales bacterium]|jgi:sigma-B regulation protein RsbU (phosphoserine phosphatase)